MMVRRQWEIYSEGAEESDNKVDPRNWRVSRSIYVGESDDEARMRRSMELMANEVIPQLP